MDKEPSMYIFVSEPVPATILSRASTITISSVQVTKKAGLLGFTLRECRNNVFMSKVNKLLKNEEIKK